MTQPVPRWFDLRDASAEAIRPTNGLLSLSEFADLDQRSVAEVEKELTAGQLVGCEIDGEVYVLEALLDPRIDRDLVARVSRVLKPAVPGARVVWFRSARASLGGLTPFAALLQGNVSAVVRAARIYVEG